MAEFSLWQLKRSESCHVLLVSAFVFYEVEGNLIRLISKIFEGGRNE